jgi:hypothetical protein
LGTSGSRSEILGRFLMVSLEKNEKGQWTGRVIIEEVLSRVKEEKSIIHAIKKKDG